MPDVSVLAMRLNPCPGNDSCLVICSSCHGEYWRSSRSVSGSSIGCRSRWEMRLQARGTGCGGIFWWHYQDTRGICQRGSGGDSSRVVSRVRSQGQGRGVGVREQGGRCSQVLLSGKSSGKCCSFTAHYLALDLASFEFLCCLHLLTPCSMYNF